MNKIGLCLLCIYIFLIKLRVFSPIDLNIFFDENKTYINLNLIICFLYVSSLLIILGYNYNKKIYFADYLKLK